MNQIGDSHILTNHALTIGAALASDDVGLWPWLVGWLGLSALSLRHGGFPGRARLQAGSALLLALGWWSMRWVKGAEVGAPSYPIDCAVVRAPKVEPKLSALQTDVEAKTAKTVIAIVFIAIPPPISIAKRLK